MDIKLILLDMDGVLADFVGGCAKLFDAPDLDVREWDFYKSQLGLTETEFWDRISKAGPSFWSDLKQYRWFDQLVEVVQGYAPFLISTSPSQCPTSHSGKMQWLQKRFGKPFNSYMLGPRKELFAKEGVVLIDDANHNVRKFREHGGKAILFPQEWNENSHRAWDNRVEYVNSMLDKFSKMRKGHKHLTTKAMCPRCKTPTSDAARSCPECGVEFYSGSFGAMG